MQGLFLFRSGFGLSKKRSGIRAFFSTTAHPFMPRFLNSEQNYEKRYKTSDQAQG